MVYRAIGIMSGSSLDGLDIAFAEFQEAAGKWDYKIINASCYKYDEQWLKKLQDAVNMRANDYQLLHTAYGKFIGEKINEFIAENNLSFKINLIASHGHTTFHLPEKKMTHQLGDGAAIAAETKLPVVSDLRTLDIALGGQGAPIVPLGEHLLFNNYNFFLNIGGIANISIKNENDFIAFDICPANRILNMLAQEKNFEYDHRGSMASRGSIHEELLEQLNQQEYYKKPFPKSLANSYGTEIIYPLIKSFKLNIEDALSTYVEHICIQTKNSLQKFKKEIVRKIFTTGGGAYNTFLINKLNEILKEINFEIYLPEDNVINYKEAMIMALLGVLRWREQYTILNSVTGSSHNSIGGALWLGTEA